MTRDQTCCKCGAVIGLYPSGQQVVKRYARVEIVCHVCAGPNFGIPAPGAIGEIIEAIHR